MFQSHVSWRRQTSLMASFDVVFCMALLTGRCYKQGIVVVTFLLQVKKVTNLAW